MKRHLARRLAGRLAAALVALLRATWRVRLVNAEARARAWAEGGGGPPLYAFFHGHLLCALAARPERGTAVMVSRSRDGELAAAALGALGLDPVRGSVGGGGAAALVGLVHRVQRGAPACAAIDGSRGPRYAVHAGLLHVASRTGRPVLGAAMAARPARVFERAWDGFTLPGPFARVVVVFAEPLVVTRGDETAAAAELRGRMLAALERARAEAGLAPLALAGPGGRDAEDAGAPSGAAH